MAGIALFVPDNDTFDEALTFLENKDNNVSIIKKIKTEDATKHAMDAISQGVNIIIARGRQAYEIKKHTNAVVVELKVTAQELALIIMKAKKYKSKEHLKVALFYWSEMICDTTYFNEIFNIELVKYQLDDIVEWRNILKNSIHEDTDVIISGSREIYNTKDLDILSLYLAVTKESLDIALESAEQLYKMYLSREYSNAQFNSILVSSLSGIIKVNTQGTILVMNHIMKDIIKDADKSIGKNLTELLKDIDMDTLNKVLSGELENYSTFTKYMSQELVVSIEPIKIGNITMEAIVACNRLNKVNVEEKNTMQEQYLKGRSASITFDDIDKNMKDLKKISETAKIYSTSSSPILIEAVSGPELEMLTQGIHNYSMRKNAPFIAINLAGMTEEQQETTIFGDYKNNKNIKGAIENAKYGTLVIKSIDRLTLHNQYKLISCIRSKYLRKNNSDEEVVLVDTRIIACCAKDLTKLREKFLFRSDLYFKLRSLRLRIPKLSDRKDDVVYLLNSYIQKYMKQYSKYHVLTSGAKKVLQEYQWQGNSIQLDAFCERMILTLNKRHITEGYVRDLLDELYHTDASIYKETSKEIVGKRTLDSNFEKISLDDPYEELLIKTLAKYEGNRALTAKELKISTTTLWRKIKKYGLDEKNN